jgi:hypothetical protein
MQWRDPARRGLIYEVVNAYGIEMAIGYLLQMALEPENPSWWRFSRRCTTWAPRGTGISTATAARHRQ